MNVQLRNGNGYPSRGSMPPPRMSRRNGIGLTPGYTAAQQAMADAYRSQSGGGGAVYQAPTVVANPACLQDTSPGGSAFSQECQDQLIATNLQNIANNTAANYNVDVANCQSAWAENDARYASMGLPRPSNDCAQRTFGLTLPNSSGGTSVDLTNAATLLGDQAAKDAAARTLAAEGVPTPSPAAPQQTPKATPPQTGGTTAASTNAGGSSSSSSSTSGAAVSTPVNPAWYWIAGLAAVALIISAVK